MSYTPAQVQNLTPIRESIEYLAKQPDLRDVFLCHAWDDRKGAAKELHDLLESKGVRVWFSEKDVDLGVPLLRAIDKGSRLSRTFVHFPDTEEIFYYDGSGLLIKSVVSVDIADDNEPAEIETNYNIRSTVLGGEVISKADQYGFLSATYVWAAGTVLAVAFPNSASVWMHKDPAMNSFRSTQPNGQVSGSGAGSDFAPHELDPSGKSVGFADPYPYGVPAPQPEMMQPFESFGSLVNGQFTTQKVDGMQVTPDQFDKAMDSAFQGPFGLVERQAKMSVKFAGYSLKFKNGDVSFAGYDLNKAVGRMEGGETLIRNWFVSDNWAANSLLNGQISDDTRADTASDKKKLSAIDSFFLKLKVNELLTDKCKTFITNLVAKAAEITNNLWNSADKQARKSLWEPRSDTYVDIASLFDSVSKQGGFFGSIRATTSTISGNIKDGDATVYLSSFNGFGPTMAYGKAHRVSDAALTRMYVRNITDRALTAIHELIHFNFHDVTLAQAVAAMNRDTRFSSTSTTDSSNYWHKELKKHCGK